MTTPTLILQGIACLTFGLAFFGLWHAFRRPAAVVWAIAMTCYGVGAMLAAAAFALEAGASGRMSLAGVLVALPAMSSLFVGMSLFEVGSAILAGRTVSRQAVVARAVTGAALGLSLVVAVGVANRMGFVFVAHALTSVVPRVGLAAACFFAISPLWRFSRPERRVEFLLLGLGLAANGVRFLVAAGLAYASLRPGITPDSPALLIAHVSILIFLGVAIALALVGQERVAAHEAARTIRDTAEALRNSNIQLRFVIEHSSDLLLVADQERRVQFIAPSSERSLGIPAEELMGRDLLELIHPDDRASGAAAFEGGIREELDEGRPMALRIRHHRGEWIPFDVLGRRVIDADGRPTLVLSARDVSVQRRLESALVQSQKLEALGRMAAGVAHDFSNILTAITAGTSFARESLPRDSGASTDLDAVASAADRGAALTRQLLTFAKLQSIAPERFDARTRIGGLEGLIRHLVGPRVDLIVAAASDELPVFLDPSQFDQVILNLAANARDAMPTGGGLTLRFGLGDPGADHGAAPRRVRIEVEDTGPGIPPEILPRIFEPFFTTKGPRGTGLGLASAYGFAQQAGGELRAERVGDRGARFVLDLPLAPDRLPASQARAETDDLRTVAAAS